MTTKLTFAQGVSISFTSFFFHVHSIFIVLAVILGACSTLAESFSPSLDNNVNIDSSVDAIETSRIVIVGANGGLLTNRDDIFFTQELPPRYELYWDYNVATKMLAYAGSEYHTLPEATWSVSDFWSYEYQSNVEMRWWSS